MTEERLPLNELLQKAGDGDFLRAVAESVLQLLMEADVEGLIGAGRHERAADRLNWRRYHVVPSGPSAVKLGGEHGTYASANSRGTAVLVAIELSKMTWLLAVYDPFTSKVSHRRVDGGDADGLIALLGRSRRDIQERAGTSVGIECVFEAGYDGFWLQRRLAEAEIACRVMDPASLKVDRRARRVKTDRVNSESLLRALQGLATW